MSVPKVTDPKEQQRLNDEERCQTLASISGLVVTCRRDKGQRVFMFARPHSPETHVKETFTYPKAKQFAEGVRLGRELGRDQTARMIGMRANATPHVSFVDGRWCETSR